MLYAYQLLPATGHLPLHLLLLHQLLELHCMHHFSFTLN
jgi:hypothetical protein